MEKQQSARPCVWPSAEALCSGEEVTFSSLSEEELRSYERALLEYLDTLELGVRERFDATLNDSTVTVDHFLFAVKVCRRDE